MADKVSSGDPLPRSASLWNAIIDAANNYSQTRQLGTAGTSFNQPVPTDIVKLKNSSGGHLRLGEVLEVSDFLLTDVVRTSLWFDGDTPDGTRPFAIALQDIPDGSIDRAQMSGAGVAWVNVSSGSHEYAESEAGEVILRSSYTGPLRILYKPPGTGTLLCAVMFIIRKCCVQGCWEASDDFERTASTDLGADWDECDGDWEIVEYPTSSGNMVLRANDAGYVVWLKSPDNDIPRTGIMRVKILAPTEGAHYRITAFYDDACTEGSWIAADLVVGASNSAVLTLVDASGPVESSAGTTGVSGTLNATSFTMELCVGLNHVRAAVSSFIYPVRVCHDENYNDKLYFALSNESETDIAIFDDAYQIEHYDHDTECPTCDCSCDGYCSPLDMCLEFHDDPEYGGCANIDGDVVNLAIGATPCRWISDTWTCNHITGQFQIERIPGGDAGSEPASSYRLSLVNGGTVIKTWGPNANSTCDPFYLEYDVDTWGDSCLLRCCDGDDIGETTPCPDGSTPQDCNVNPSITENFCKGHFYITVVDGVCPT
jgi:hypothetical protein